MAPRNSINGASATLRGSGTSADRRAASVRTSRTPALITRALDTLGWWATPLAVAVVVAAFVLTYYPVARVQYRETREEARLRSELDALTQRNVRLRRQVATLRTPEGVEDYARSRLGLVKPGEHVVVVTEGAKTLAPSALAVAPRIDSDEAIEAPSGPWTAFLDRVFGVQ